MPLRDFERVRERIELHLEVRHIAQIAVGGLAMLALSFGAGWWVASSRQVGPVPLPPPAQVEVAPLPAPRPDLAQRREPVLPMPVASRSRTEPKLARVLESIVRDQPLASATAAEHREEPVRSETAESPFEHVASQRREASPRAGAPAASRPRAALPIRSGAIVDARPESQDANRPEGWPEVATIPAEFAQSQPLRPLALASSIDTTRIVRIEPPGLYLTGLVGPDGAAIGSPVEAGGETVNQPMLTALPAGGDAALQRWLAAEDRREQERLAAERAEQDRLAAEKAEQERVAAQKAQLIRFAAEKKAEEARLLAQKKAEEARLLAQKKAEEARLLAQKKAEEARLLAQKKAGQARLLLQKKAEQARMLAEKEADRARLAELKDDRERLMREQAARRKAQPVKPAAAPVAKARPAPKSDGRSFFVQVKAFRNLPEARVFARLLKDRGHKPLISRITVPKQGEFHRVRIGPYSTYELARAAQRRFQAREPYETMVMSR